ncbi:RNA polymerase sigma factor [Stratiformator vulcanicus]|uniref:ECF RNA polymerase sigma factor SigD n=1 Tax=Stratiformator vulcanicus TaxID=2527980 RepID=A0A517QZI0_9PLAN|nr:sigma-70 family RNA polymerase sigma factor [Stratiformator vulcanicus]QDT37055.1 ECF RNA polymerase sigma factor SigD [Stratiformator vulcanicus]
MPSSEADRLLVGQVRTGDERAWEELIARFEGRLIAYVDARLRNRSRSEDVVQETFIGFLTSLPNYDEATPLDSFLFSIAAHKLTDLLRREGRRPTVPLFANSSWGSSSEPAGRGRRASSMMRSREGKVAERRVIEDCLADLIIGWKGSGDWERLKCLELLLVSGMGNKDVARELGITEQAVANHKFFVVAKLKDAAANARVRDFRIEEYGLSDTHV